MDDRIEVQSPFFCRGRDTGFFFAAVCTPKRRPAVNLAPHGKERLVCIRARDANVDPQALLFESDRPELARRLKSTLGYKPKAFKIGYITAHVNAMKFDEDWESHITLVNFVAIRVLKFDVAK